jgi:UDP-N-acetylmuramate dehydrogenase
MSSRWADSIAATLQARGIAVERNAPLAPLTTFRIGGPAALIARVTNTSELVVIADLITALSPEQRPAVLVIGQGSNLLVSDAGIDGLVIRLDPSGFSEIDFARVEDHRILVTAGGAVKLPVLARASVAESCTGLEWMVGVPGSVGGAVRMNAGGHGSDAAANLVRAHIISMVDGELGWVDAGDLDLGYRRSRLEAHHIVTHAEFGCGSGERADGERELTEIVRWRREHQPGGANCGSVFTNPPGDSAGRLIDAAGLKGARIGGAWVSDKHANFIQADPGATAADVLAVIDMVRRVVRDRNNIDLHPEVRMVGFPPAPRASSTSQHSEPRSS